MTVPKSKDMKNSLRNIVDASLLSLFAVSMASCESNSVGDSSNMRDTKVSYPEAKETIPSRQGTGHSYTGSGIYYVVEVPAYKMSNVNMNVLR